LITSIFFKRLKEGFALNFGCNMKETFATDKDAFKQELNRKNRMPFNFQGKIKIKLLWSREKMKE